MPHDAANTRLAQGGFRGRGFEVGTCFEIKHILCLLVPADLIAKACRRHRKKVGIDIITGRGPQAASALALPT